MRRYEDLLTERFRADKQEAIDYLNACLEEDDPRVFLVALKDVARAWDISIKDLAERAGLTEKSLYKTLSEKGNPEHRTITAILNALGLGIKLELRQAG